MSANIQEAVQRQREMLYADKTDEQVIMMALHWLLVSVCTGHDALKAELFDRAATKKSDD